MRRSELIKKLDDREFYCRSLPRNDFRETCVFKHGQDASKIFYSDGFIPKSIYKKSDILSDGSHWFGATKKEAKDFIGEEIFKTMINA